MDRVLEGKRWRPGNQDDGLGSTLSGPLGLFETGVRKENWLQKEKVKAPMFDIISAACPGRPSARYSSAPFTHRFPPASLIEKSTEKYTIGKGTEFHAPQPPTPPLPSLPACGSPDRTPPPPADRSRAAHRLPALQAVDGSWRLSSCPPQSTSPRRSADPSG
jgi:hypothetical protein